MSIESTMKIRLKEIGFEEKNVQTWDWSLKHDIYGTVVYRAKKGKYFFFFNNLTKFMTRIAKIEFGVNDDMSFNQRKVFYDIILSRLDYYDKIKHHLTFSRRKKVGGNYFGIAESVGSDTINKVLDSVISAGRNGDSLFLKSNESNKKTTINRSSKDIYTLDGDEYKKEFNLALRQLAKPKEKVLISEVEDRIERNFKEKGINLKNGWRKS